MIGFPDFSLKGTSFIMVKVKVKHPVTGTAWPRGFQEVKVPRLCDSVSIKR